MTHNVEVLRRVIDRDISVLLLGETGTGKGYCARAIHYASNRADKPFVTVNCAAIPETLIESELFGHKPGAFTGAAREGGMGRILQANGGTLFLDEIGDMPVALQARLLNVIEDREVMPLGRQQGGERRRAHRQRHAARSAAIDRQAAVPRGPVLPAERHHRAHAAAAPAQRQRRADPQAARSETRCGPAVDDRAGAARAAGASLLAGQRAPAAQRAAHHAGAAHLGFA